MLIEASARVSSQTTMPPEKPPDKGGTGDGEGSFVTAGVTFREKVMGGQAVVKPSIRKDLLAEKLAYVEYIGGSKYALMVHLDDKVAEELSEPLNEALIIKLLVKTIRYKVMKDRLQPLWKLEVGFDMHDIGNGFFRVKFDKMEDRSKVMQGESWMLSKHYLFACI